MKKLCRLGPVLSSLEASTESLWLWSHRSGEEGWGCQAQQPAEGRLAPKSTRMESSPQPQCRVQPQFMRLRPPTNTFFPCHPGSLSWDMSQREWSPPCLGKEMCTAVPAQLQHVSTTLFLAVGCASPV